MRFTSRQGCCLSALSLGVITFVGLRSFAAHNVIFSPKKYSTSDIVDLERRTRVIQYKTSQGSQAAYFIKSKEKLSELFIIFPGNASTAKMWVEHGFKVVDEIKGAGVLLIDYPGFGVNEGDPFPESIRESAEQAFLYTKREFNFSKESVSFIGHSMGCAASLDFARVLKQKGQVLKKLVLIAPFTRLSDTADQWGLRPFVRFEYDNIAALESINKFSITPVVIYHGSKDRIVPPSMSKNLSFRPGVSRIEMEGDGHNSVVKSCFEFPMRELLEGINSSATHD